MSWSKVKTGIKKSAYLYVVWSIGWEIIQMGHTQDLVWRLEGLNRKSSCGVNDWEMLYSGKYGDIDTTILELTKKLKEHSTNYRTI